MTEDFGEVVVDDSWLNQLEDVIFGHGISLLRWRSGGVKHPHDMPPFRFSPSPTFGDSSLAAEFKHKIKVGRDVGAEHIAAKRNLLSSDKFAGSARDFIEQHAKRKTRRWLDTARLLGFAPQEDGILGIIKGGLADRWREKPVAEIGDDVIFDLIEQTREK